VFTLGYRRKCVPSLTVESSARRWAEPHEETFRRPGGAARVVGPGVADAARQRDRAVVTEHIAVQRTPYWPVVGGSTVPQVADRDLGRLQIGADGLAADTCRCLDAAE
jgi:hypothetical protein